MQNLCQVILDSVNSEVFPDLNNNVILAGLSHAGALARASDGFRH